MILGEAVSAVVTGGASGLGRACAASLRQSGCRVAIFDIDAVSGNAAARDLDVHFCEVDITDEGSLLQGFKKARAAHGQERLLIHCSYRTGRVEWSTDQD